MPEQTTGILLSVLLGGISGALVTAINNRFLEKEKRALEFVKDYFAIREKIGSAKGYLQDVDAIIANPLNAMILIREVGDRLNSIAYYYIKNILRRDLLEESGVITDIEEFLHFVDKAQVAFRSIDIDKHPDIGEYNLDKVGVWWPHLCDLRAYHLKRRLK